MKRPTALLLVLLAVALAGCATSYGSSSPPPTSVRCLSDPNERGGTRPMFFLFCLQSP